jgi:hypothetical protein
MRVEIDGVCYVPMNEIPIHVPKDEVILSQWFDAGGGQQKTIREYLYELIMRHEASEDIQKTALTDLKHPA